MPFKEKLSEMTGMDPRLLPSSYQVIGHVMLLKFMKIEELSEKKKVAAALLSLFPYAKTVCEIKGVSGQLRKPKIIKLAGDGTETVHKEHGIFYSLDASKIMFSKGNLFERQRLVSQVKKNETVVDMFAGIGYFSLGMARRAKKVIAIEKNPAAFRYLKRNIGLNNAKNIEPILGDNRKMNLENTADRVIMGYFQTDRRTKGASIGSERFLPFAASMLKKKGVIHFHNVYNKGELWHKAMEHLEEAENTSRFTYKILAKKKVKSVSPNRYHVVLDVLVKKA